MTAEAGSQGRQPEAILTEEDKRWLVNAMREHNCPMNSEEIRTIKEVVAIVRALGEDNLNKGIERFRDQNKYLLTFMTRKSIIYGACLLSVVGVVAMWAAKALWHGFQNAVGGP
jgi:hypothetical protein